MKYFSVLLRAVLVLHPQPAWPRVPQAACQGGGWPTSGCALPLVLDKGLYAFKYTPGLFHAIILTILPSALRGGYTECSPLSALGSKILVTRISVTRVHVTRDTRFYHPSLCNMLWSIFEGNIFICLEFGNKQTFFLKCLFLQISITLMQLFIWIFFSYSTI